MGRHSRGSGEAPAPLPDPPSRHPYAPRSTEDTGDRDRGSYRVVDVGLPPGTPGAPGPAEPIRYGGEPRRGHGATRAEPTPPHNLAAGTRPGDPRGRPAPDAPPLGGPRFGPSDPGESRFGGPPAEPRFDGSGAGPAESRPPVPTVDPAESRFGGGSRNTDESRFRGPDPAGFRFGGGEPRSGATRADLAEPRFGGSAADAGEFRFGGPAEIGRASCRERVCLVV